MLEKLVLFHIELNQSIVKEKIQIKHATLTISQVRIMTRVHYNNLVIQVMPNSMKMSNSMGEDLLQLLKAIMVSMI